LHSETKTKEPTKKKLNGTQHPGVATGDQVQEIFNYAKKRFCTTRSE
jgi:hypothetical protein